MNRLAPEAPLDETTPFPPEAPLRCDPLGAEYLDDLARRVATPARQAEEPRSRQLLRRLKENAAVLKSARDDAAAVAARNEPLMPDAEWLLDNFFVIESVLHEVRTDLPGGYYDELPAGADGHPRVYA